MESGKTTIVVSRRTVAKLKSLGKKGETYEQIVQRLLNRAATQNSTSVHQSRKEKGEEFF